MSAESENADKQDKALRCVALETSRDDNRTRRWQQKAREERRKLGFVQLQSLKVSSHHPSVGVQKLLYSSAKWAFIYRSEACPLGRRLQ